MAFENVSKKLLELANKAALDVFPKNPTNNSAADLLSLTADDFDPAFSSDSDYSTDSDDTSSEYSFFEPPRPCSPPPGYLPWQYGLSDDGYDTDASSVSCDSAASVYSMPIREDWDTEVSSPLPLSEEDERLLAETYALLDPQNKPRDDIAGQKPPCTLGAVSFPILTVTGNVVVVKIEHPSHLANLPPFHHFCSTNVIDEASAMRLASSVKNKHTVLGLPNPATPHPDRDGKRGVISPNEPAERSGGLGVGRKSRSSLIDLLYLTAAIDRLLAAKSVVVQGIQLIADD
ncbi:hypothetical protein QBC34DRAFT_421593 [Podospora aff. communis PSN243]|uniref:Uncharacterized protein n=1 Tax=Podospora aff. communis PSN243 TaxID=3040156 RepID=A0AAV9H2X9_9PEZI|nr:hypothetical protein QBC34DRAFT_421593 [Podospora aff. communis PSN243]